MQGFTQRPLPEEVMKRKEMMIIEKIKRSRLIYGTAHLTTRAIRGASQSNSGAYLRA